MLAPASSTRSRTTWASIMDLAKTEAMLFKYGSGAGVNLSPIRGSHEKMSAGGIASGPVSFMSGYDAFAGVIKSGGTTRRAAKMVILDADHPDVLDFIDSKAHEEQKAWALIEAGLRPLASPARRTAASSSRTPTTRVRVTDEFMRAVERDGDWATHERDQRPGRPARTRPARSSARWPRRPGSAATPGIQYDTTINDWHTSANTDRIYASQPVLRVHVPQRHGVQPRLAEPHEVRRRRWRVRRRGLSLRLPASRSRRRRSSSTTRATPRRRSRRTPTASGRSAWATPTSARC